MAKTQTIVQGLHEKLEQAINECHEEARFDITNVRYTGITYTEDRVPPKKAIINGRETEMEFTIHTLTI